MGDETLKKIAQELVENLRQNISVDWLVRDNVMICQNETDFITSCVRPPP
jgi:hypothetical protein